MILELEFIFQIWDLTCEAVFEICINVNEFSAAWCW